jgi:hypothetical protein
MEETDNSPNVQNCVLSTNITSVPEFSLKLKGDSAIAK